MLEEDPLLDEDAALDEEWAVELELEDEDEELDDEDDEPPVPEPPLAGVPEALDDAGEPPVALPVETAALVDDVPVDELFVDEDCVVAPPAPAVFAAPW